MSPHCSCKLLLVLVVTQLISSCTAFSVVPSRRSNAIRLHLVPSQGNQLVAASCCAYESKSSSSRIVQEDEERGSQNTSTRTMTASTNNKKPTSFVSRVFSRSTNHPRDDEWLYWDDYYTQQEQLHQQQQVAQKSGSHHQNIEFYPIVGFVYVQDAPDHSRPLPTTYNVSCPLHYHDKQHKEDVYGWYSPVCFLDD